MKNDYSQHKLHDYLECQCRYELKYIQQIVWPAVLSEPVLELEEQMKNGELFHLMAQQYFLGIDQEIILQQDVNGKMKDWWGAFVDFADYYKSFRNQSEVLISTKINSFRFIGIFDVLISIPGEKFIILDWKTNRTKPTRKYLSNHIQTRLYPLLLTSSGEPWNKGKKIFPDQIEMIYWFANDPDHPESFLYSEKQYQEDLTFMVDLVHRIENTKIGAFNLTDDERRCKFCNYRSLCGRGKIPGNFKDEETIDFADLYQEIEEIDMNQIGDIAF